MNRPLHNSQHGQVMIMAIIIMVVVMLAIFFIFDVQTFIRAKVKLETASQSAALTAANWQKNCLNLIGEINLIKASTLLTSTISTPVPPAGLSADEAQQLQIQAACDSLTEMQSRISFIGPLIGYGAASQAMKNNGVTKVQEYDEMMDKYLVLLNTDDRYKVGVNEYINNYKWRDAYIGMIEKLKDEGTVIRPSGQFQGLEGINPSWMADTQLWKAIRDKNWCQPTLRTIIQFDDRFWLTQWWKVKYQQSQFPDESEIYTLGIDFKSDDRKIFDMIADQAVRAGLTRLNITDDKLPAIQWCKYSSKWSPTNSDGSWNYDYDGPDVSPDSYWHAGIWLRAELKKNVIHGGACAVAACSQQFTPMSKYKVERTITPGYDKSKASEPEFLMRDYKRNETGKIIETTGYKLKEKVDNGAVQMGGDAVAQPIVKPDGEAPFKSIVILPVFYDAILIPTTIRTVRRMPMPDDETINYELFLTWLSKVDNIDDDPPSPPFPLGYDFTNYLQAFQTLNKASFRKEGFNNANKGVVYTINTLGNPGNYFDDGYKYPNKPDGPGWLQQVCVNTVPMPVYIGPGTAPVVPKTIREDVTSANGDTKLWLLNRYIIRKADGSLYTNDGYVCIGVRGSGGTCYPLGTHSAPSRL